jgi:hypothetical protein
MTEPNAQRSRGSASITRREALRRLAAAGLLAPAAVTSSRRALAVQPASTPIPASSKPGLRGINYDIGTSTYGPDGVPGALSREGWTSETIARSAMRDEFDVIRDRVGLSAISIYGSDAARMADGAAMALERGLHVWLQPRLMEAPIDDTLVLVADVAEAAEQLRRDAPAIGINVGVEASVFTAGILPGDSFEERVASLGGSEDDLATYFANLNAYLAQAVDTVKSSFDGDVIYSAGPWEWWAIDWTLFDFVGVDYYMDSSNQATYVTDLQSLQVFEKPIVITEFGCCCYEGAELRGGDGYDIVDWTASPPRLNGDYVRSEQTQSDYLMKLLDIYDAEAVASAFIWTFIGDSPYSDDPVYDLDMADFTIVKAMPESGYPPPPGTEYTNPGPGDWEPKIAFHELGRRFGSR